VACFPNVTTFAENKTREQAGVAGRKKKGITWPKIFRHITLLINGSLQEFKPVLLIECPQQDNGLKTRYCIPANIESMTLCNK
jgi:hypothetical protein